MVVFGRLWIISRIYRVMNIKKIHKQTKKARNESNSELDLILLSTIFVCVLILLFLLFIYFLKQDSNDEGRKSWAHRILTTQLYWLWWFFYLLNCIFIYFSFRTNIEGWIEYFLYQFHLAKKKYLNNYIKKLKQAPSRSNKKHE